jgi:hypothetical protein
MTTSKDREAVIRPELKKHGLYTSKKEDTFRAR